MATKDRNQNPVVGDTVRLRLATYSSNNLQNVSEIDKIEIYRLDKNLCSESNKDGRTLITTIDGSEVVNEEEGVYLLSLTTSSPTYAVDKYLDVWFVKFETNDELVEIENYFELFPQLWYTSTTPAVYGFEFSFQPNRIRQGSKKWLIIKIIPNVPRSTDLERYYTNLAISSEIYINIEQNCVPCPPEDNDLRIIVEDELVTVRDKVFGFYQLDTTEDGLDLDCGIYNVWFELHYAGNIDISSKYQMQIY